MSEFAYRSPYLELLRRPIVDEATGRIQSDVPVQAGKGYSFLECVCGSSHWVCVIPEIKRGEAQTGLPPVIAYICRECMRLLDGDRT